MKCVIIGAGGFIGRHLGRHLHAGGHDVLGLDVPACLGEADAFPLDACDVTRDELHLTPGLDAVFYLAQSPFYRDFPAHAGDLFDVNVTGTVRAAEAAQAAGARRFIFTSTGTVYAPGFEPLREDGPLRDDQPYAVSKRCAEAAVHLFAERLEIVSTRLFGVFGPGQTGGLVPGVAARVRDGRAVTLQPHPEDPADDGGLRMSLTFVTDLVRCFERLADPRRPAPPKILNVAGPEAVSVRRLAQAIGASLDIEPIFEIADQPRESDYVADIARLESVVGPRFTRLRVGIMSALGVVV